MQTFFKQRYSLPIIVILVLIIAFIWISTQPAIQHESNPIQIRKVEFIYTDYIPHKARALGYGVVEPTVMLKANAEVAGKVVYLHPELKRGATLPKGTRVLEIDKTNYKVALAKAQADLAAHNANLQQLQVEKQNSETSLAISSERLELGIKELARKKRLLKQKSISQSTVDIETQNVLNLRQEVQNLKGQLSLIPTRQQVLKAQVTAATAQVDEQQKNIERTDVTLPFDARIGEVHTQEEVFVSVNAGLFDASDIAQVEIKAQMSMMHARTLLLDVIDNTQFRKHIVNISELLNKIKLSAHVRWVERLETAQWQARVIRVGEELDRHSRTLPVIVAVDNSYQSASPGKRPPLLKGMYTEVEIQAPAVNRMVIPRRAIHNNHVYIANNNKLEIRPISINFHQGELSVISDGLKPQEQLITTDLVPAFAGMELSLVHNKDLQLELINQASGQGAFK